MTTKLVHVASLWCMSFDRRRVEADQFPLTWKFLAQMLGRAGAEQDDDRRLLQNAE